MSAQSPSKALADLKLGIIQAEAEYFIHLNWYERLQGIEFPGEVLTSVREEMARHAKLLSDRICELNLALEEVEKED